MADHQVNPSPSDSVSCLKFAPGKDFFAAGSWDNSVPVMQLAANTHSQAVLAECWSPDGGKIFTGSADKSGKCWDLASNQVMQYAQHDAPIKCVHWIEAHNMIVTGGWDNQLKFWPVSSLGSGTPAATVKLSERVYAMDVKGDCMVVALADKNVLVFDVRNQPSQPMKTIPSPLRHQIRTVSLFPDKRGYAMGSIEGRVQIYHINDTEASKNFAFKCHRDTNTADIYSVNSIVFHQQHGTFVTAGSDGTFHFWDKDAKQRLKGFPKAENSISAVDFNHTGDIFGYAVAYDWSKGYDRQNRAMESRRKSSPSDNVTLVQHEWEEGDSADTCDSNDISPNNDHVINIIM